MFSLIEDGFGQAHILFVVEFLNEAGKLAFDVADDGLGDSIEIVNVHGAIYKFK